MNFINLSSYIEEDSKNDRILQTFHSLPIGDKFMVENNDDLDSLLSKLEEEYSNVVEWEYIKEGPDEWQVLISKKAYNFI